MENSDKYIKVVKNFIDKEDVDFIVRFIESNLDNFSIYQDGTRYVWKFGKDFTFLDSCLDFSNTKELEPLFRNKIFPKIIKYINDFYLDNNIEASIIWLSKHSPGSVVEMHNDQDGGKNPQLKYSTILYLNSLDGTGILEFPWSNFTYTPASGDLVLFPSEDIDFENQFAHRVSEIKETRYTVPIWFAQPEYAL